jgi:hypothetical protein
MIRARFNDGLYLLSLITYFALPTARTLNGKELICCTYVVPNKKADHMIG